MPCVFVQHLHNSWTTDYHGGRLGHWYDHLQIEGNPPASVALLLRSDRPASVAFDKTVGRGRNFPNQGSNSTPLANLADFLPTDPSDIGCVMRMFPVCTEPQSFGGWVVWIASAACLRYLVCHNPNNTLHKKTAAQNLESSIKRIAIMSRHWFSGLFRVLYLYSCVRWRSWQGVGLIRGGGAFKLLYR